MNQDIWKRTMSSNIQSSIFNYNLFFLLLITYCLLFIAYCLLFIVYCLLIIAYCLLFIDYCLLPIAYCLLFIDYCLLPIAYCLLPIAYCLLFIVYWFLTSDLWLLPSLWNWHRINVYFEFYFDHMNIEAIRNYCLESSHIRVSPISSSRTLSLLKFSLKWRWRRCAVVILKVVVFAIFF